MTGDTMNLYDASLFLVLCIGLPVAYWRGFTAGKAAENARLQPQINRVAANVQEMQSMQAGQPSPDVQWPVTIGQRFSYLGISMLCTGYHVQPSPGVMVPALTAEYVDADGLIRQTNWPVHQLPAVRAELAAATRGMPL